MKKIFNSAGMIKKNVPTLDDLYKGYGSNEFIFEPVSSDVWMVEEFMDMTEGDYGVMHSIGESNIVYYSRNYLVGPYWSYNKPFTDRNQSYWRSYLKLIPYTNMVQSILRMSVFSTYNLLIYSLIYSFEHMFKGLQARWTREPRSGLGKNPLTDKEYKEAFNKGYEWRYAYLNIRPRNKEESWMNVIQNLNNVNYKTELGIKKSIGTIFPGYAEWDKQGVKQWKFRIQYTLNGKYWTVKKTWVSAQEDYRYRWNENSYCYYSRTAEVTITYNQATGRLEDNVAQVLAQELNAEVGSRMNVGRDPDREYYVSDIPIQDRIWR